MIFPVIQPSRRLQAARPGDARLGLDPELDGEIGDAHINRAGFDCQSLPDTVNIAGCMAKETQRIGEPSMTFVLAGSGGRGEIDFFFSRICFIRKDRQPRWMNGR